MGKVVFLTFSKGGTGFWLRYTSSQGVPSLWLSVFRKSDVSGMRVRYLGGYFKLSDSEVILGDSRFSLSEGEALGRSKAFSWNIRIKSLEKEYNPIPPLIRLLRRDKYVILTPLAVFDGHINVGENRYEVNEYLGMVGLIDSRRELREWGWTHCSGFDEYDRGWIDLLVTKVGDRYIALGLVKSRRGLYNIGGMWGRVFRGNLGLGGISWSFKLSGLSVGLRVTSSPGSMIIAEYEDPGGTRYCHNTEIGDMELLIDGERYSCADRAFFEYGTTQPLPVPRRVIAIDESVH